jgi:hypothetical protein
VNITTLNVLPTNIGTPSVLEIQSPDTNDEAINIITKKLYFTNKIDGTNQLVIDNEGIFVKEFDRENALEISEGFINLQDWMAKIQEIVSRLGGLDGSGHSFRDLICDIFGVGSILAQAGIFAAVYSAMNSLVSGRERGQGRSTGFEFARVGEREGKGRIGL